MEGLRARDHPPERAATAWTALAGSVRPGVAKVTIILDFEAKKSGSPHPVAHALKASPTAPTRSPPPHSTLPHLRPTPPAALPTPAPPTLPLRSHGAAHTPVGTPSTPPFAPPRLAGSDTAAGPWRRPNSP